MKEKTTNGDYLTNFEVYIYSSTMAMREERPLAVDNSSKPISTSFNNNINNINTTKREPSVGALSRPGSRPGSTLQLNSQIPPSKDITSQLNLEIRPLTISNVSALNSLSGRQVAMVPTHHKEFVSRPIEVSINPTLPSPLSKQNDSTPVLDEQGEIIRPKMSAIVPNKVPDWMIIMTVYSMVIVR